MAKAKLNLKTLYAQVELLKTYASKLTVNDPDANSQVWQHAQNLINELEPIKNRAIRLENQYSKE